MEVYKQGMAITGLAPSGYLKMAGAKFPGPEVQDVWRIDWGDTKILTAAGIWGATKGKFELTYGVNELVSLLEGRIIVTQGGKSHELKAGDSFFTPKGETVHWEILEDVRKSFVVFP